MKIGIVNPYSWDVPGGVGFHIRDLALKLRSRPNAVDVGGPARVDHVGWIVGVDSL